MQIITKTALAAGRRCPERAYRSLLCGAWGEPPAPLPQLIPYRARDRVLTEVHRLLLRGGAINPADAALDALWASAWQRAGGLGVPDPEGRAWLGSYVRTDPFGLGPGGHRALVAVERTCRATWSGRTYQARPDVLALAADGALEALELSAGRSPLLDLSALSAMAVLDLVCLRRGDLPADLRLRPLRVVVADVNTSLEFDVTPTPQEGRQVLHEIDTWLATLADAHPARPTEDGCPSCPFRQACPSAYAAPTLSRIEEVA